LDNKAINIAALTVIIVGAVNWGLIGFFNFNLVGILTGGATSFIARIVYALVGLSGIYALTMYSRLEGNSLTVKQR